MGKKIILGLLIVLFLSIKGKTHAIDEQRHAAQSAKFESPEAPKEDIRLEVLKSYLEKYNSPLAEYSGVFVAEADKYNLDWKFLASIAGVESTFANAYPQGTYNAWGWGIYGTNMHYFKSWDDAIETISRELRERYMDKWGAENVYEIGKYYAASPTWASKVVYFMDSIEKHEATYKAKNLTISL